MTPPRGRGCPRCWRLRRRARRAGRRSRAQIVFPKPEDTAYYVGVARNLLEGRGLVSDALWSYQTPPLVFPRPAFEVWLPLPTFLAAIPMAISRARRSRPPRSRRSSIGALVPVLAWRLAADVADGAWPAAGPARDAGARHRPDERGLPAARAPLGPARLDDALRGPRAGACLLMTRIARDPRGARLTDPRLLGPRRPARPRRPDPQRDASGSPCSGRASPGGHRRPDERSVSARSASSRSSRSLVFAPWAYRDSVVRQPAAGPGAQQRPLPHGLRPLRLEPPADPGALPRDRPRRPPRAARRRLSSTTCSTSCCCSACRSRPSALVALPWQARGLGPATARRVQPRDVPDHQPGVPRGDPVGHVPARRRARSTCCWSQRPPRARRGHHRARPALAGRDPSPGSGRRSASSRSRLFSPRCCRSTARGRGHGAPFRGARRPHGGDRPPARSRAPAR